MEVSLLSLKLHYRGITRMLPGILSSSRDCGVNRWSFEYFDFLTRAETGLKENFADFLSQKNLAKTPKDSTTFLNT
jgi:hypothetical protein